MAVFLQLKTIVCAIERHACEFTESWSMISAPLSTIVTVVGTESCRHPCWKEASKVNQYIITDNFCSLHQYRCILFMLHRILQHLGLSISYDRVLEVENELATAVCQDFEKKGDVVTAQLRKGLFTIGALDNVDNNTSSTTAKGSFHGTSISLF